VKTSNLTPHTRLRPKEVRGEYAVKELPWTSTQ
jgi:hypothetical protein